MSPQILALTIILLLSTGLIATLIHHQTIHPITGATIWTIILIGIIRGNHLTK